jgi:hypothetical protein
VEDSIGNNIGRQWRNWTQRLEGPYIRPRQKETIWTKDRGVTGTEAGKQGGIYGEPELMSFSDHAERDIQEESFLLIDHDGNELEAADDENQEYDSSCYKTTSGKFWSPRSEQAAEVSEQEFLAELRYASPPTFATERVPPRQIVLPRLDAMITPSHTGNTLKSSLHI